MAVEEEPEAGIPEWVVTFGDMMSLLLTFFIMLVSMSEIKQDEQYQAMVESIKQQFGYDTSLQSLAPGTTRPRTSSVEKLASLGRAKRMDSMSGGEKVRAPLGENARVQTIRPGKMVTAGGVVYFEEFSTKLSEQAMIHLQIIAQEIIGKPQKIELRGHTTRSPIPAGVTGPSTHSELAFKRCLVVKDFLVKEQNIDSKRFVLVSAGDSEPVYNGINKQELLLNARVEVGLIDERVKDREGSPEQ